VKELVENSLDAGASSIEIRLESYGLDRIEVRDNGRGFSPSQAVFVAQRHYTSKLTDFKDLEHLETYGFRGEALGSLCSLSDVCITSKTDDQEMGMTYVFKSTGEMVASKPSPGERGTTVVVQRLFKSVPVRRQMYQNPKKQGVELSRVQDLLTAFGLIHPHVRLELRHNKSVVWRKNKVADCRSAFSVLFGSSAVSQMKTVEFDLPEIGVKVHGILPKQDADPSRVVTSNSNHCVIAVNSRPVEMKSALKVLCQTAVRCQSNKSSKVQYPLGLLHLQFSPWSIDVNMEPNKTRVLVQNEEAVIANLKAKLEEFYESSDVTEVEHTQAKGSVGPTKKLDECNMTVTLSSGSDCSYESSIDKMMTTTSDGVSNHAHDVFPDHDVSDNETDCLVLQNKNGDDTNVWHESTEPVCSESRNDKSNALDWSMGQSIKTKNGSESPVEPVKILTGADVLSKQGSCKRVLSSRESPAKKLKIADRGLLKQSTVRSGLYVGWTLVV
jgi:DNA mismatch repair protein PMS1